MADRANIDISTLRQLLAYDPETGKLTWLERPQSMFKTFRAYRAWNAAHPGREGVNTPTNGGYLHGTIMCRSYKAHRVAWALHHGEWPQGDIDHINGDPSDNRIANLRVVDHQENMRNMKRRRDSSSGVTGVSWFKRRSKWMATIGGAYLGYFDTLEDARAARTAAETDRGYHRNHGRATCQK